LIPFRELAIGTAVAIRGIIESLVLFPRKFTGFERFGRDLTGCGKLRPIALDKLEALSPLCSTSDKLEACPHFVAQLHSDLMISQN
jgi:hypothetical protein